MHRTGGTVGALWSAAASDDTPPLTTPRDPAREAARRELSRRLYHENDPNLVQRALDAFWKWLGDLFDTAAGATPGGPLGLAVIALAVIAVAAALWWRLGAPRRTPASPSDALFGARARSASDHRAAAEEHAAHGHWNQAVQERMRAIVRALEERALLDARPGRTADEAAAEAAHALPDHADGLHAAARTFDDVTYGGRSASEQSYRRIAGLDETLDRTKPRLTDRQGAAR
ncbi:DUF4129 domain-containing protein [Streptomyces acidiscabies]|uniref:Membrane protein n=1 Tax=Streptomyces acidiscabies TaxID=42234 RepID=A0A0L0KLW8_9ACTN|nr:DUF4129 domain-containing protein [Streptomyces acidiscabies]KND38848.1 membrane protein [Streptomyces acidiscabies]